MRGLIAQYKGSLKKLRAGKVTPLYRGSMIATTQWAVDYMETGHIPGTKWTVARWNKKDREVLFDPQVMEKCFRFSSDDQQVSEGIRVMLEHLLSCLSPREKDAFVLIHGQGFSHSQAAEFMGISRGNIYNLLQRAEKKFSNYRDCFSKKQMLNTVSR